MHTINTESTDLYYEEMGSGEPLVLLPGAGQSAITFVDSGLAEMLARHYRVILMDFTGLGSSGRVTQMRPSQWAQDVLSVLDATAVDRAHLVGSSLGARVAARVAADSPDRVQTLVVDMPITGVDENQEARLDAFFSQYRTNVLAEFAPRWHGETWTEAMDFFVALRRRSDFREFYTPASYMASIPAPTLLCRGDADDSAHPLSQATDWHRAAQASWLWIEAGATDLALTKACPGRFVETVVRFTAAMSQQQAFS